MYLVYHKLEYLNDIESLMNMHPGILGLCKYKVVQLYIIQLMDNQAYL
jgi:hypothetical protein